MTERKWIVSRDGPFEMSLYHGNERVEFIRCQLCHETMFDDHKDGEDAWMSAVVMHLTLSHGDRYEIRK